MTSIKLQRTPYVTDAMLQVLGQHYSGLQIRQNKSDIELITERLAEDESANLNLDIQFFLENPDLPLENLCSRVDNYFPNNPSQEELLRYARALVNLQEPYTSAGLFIYGEPGVGKTHVAVGVTKEIMRRGLNSNYMRADDVRFPKHRLTPGQVWIIDDLNSPYGSGMEAFKRIVLNAHEFGGRVLATSNTTYDYLMERGFATDPGERKRYMDRTKGMFKFLHVEGKSHREESVWHSNIDFDPLDPKTWKRNNG